MALADHDPELVGHRVWTTDSKIETRLGELARLPLRPRRDVSVVLLRPARHMRPQAEDCMAAIIQAIRGPEQTPLQDPV